jgi:hypothetical protein
LLSGPGDMHIGTCDSTLEIGPSVRFLLLNIFQNFMFIIN